MSAETATGWRSVRLDRWAGRSSSSYCSPAGENNRQTDNFLEISSEQAPSTPLLKPLSLNPLSSPPPLSLPPAMRLRSPLKPQSLVEAFVRGCSCKDYSDCCTSCSCTLATTPCFLVHRGTPRSALAELKTDSNTNISICSSDHHDNSPSNLKSFRSQPVEVTSKKKRSASISPSPKAVSPLTNSRSRGLLRTRSGKRSFSESVSPLQKEKNKFFEFKENDEVAEQQAEGGGGGGGAVVSPFKRKRPPKLQIPSETTVNNAPKNKDVPLEVSVEGKCYGMYSRKGHRDVLEDTYQAVPDMEDSNARQAFFGIFDGHGGRVAAEFAADNLSRNIGEALTGGERDLEAAVRSGYLRTDDGFLQKQVSGGASCVTAFVKDGALVVANAGDCRAVMCKNGVGVALTEDHRLAREDERRRVEDLGGYVDCYSGVWRLQGVLAVSRGIGDLHLKEWVSAEPEIHKLTIDPECEFLILASDGLWDVVSNQEAVDCIRSEVRWSGGSVGGLASSSRKLVEIAAGRGSQDDISVMVVNLKHFCID